MQVVTTPSNLLLKVNESFHFLIKVFDKHGKGIPSSEVKITKVIAMDRAGYVREDNGDYHFDDLTNNTSYDGNHFISYTNKDGELKVKVSDPHGIGVRTFFKISADDCVSKEISVVFSVPTSPKSVYAKMYGHMPDFISVNNLKFYRPTLSTERTGDQVNHYLNEDWAKFTWYNAEEFCKSRNLRLPTKEELLDFYHIHSGNDLLSNYGWPIVDRFNSAWSSSAIRNMYFHDPLHFYVDFLNDKMDKEIVSDALVVFCVQDS
ncbi:hypothetical protein GJT93_02235 (plasmid) [Enterobacteriaceae endosymbiont of Donacia provostii]|nr:hypothetical protein GJT93_02235 [Enterobacteriaceae endosymbiont of Donacia provostii]